MPFCPNCGAQTATTASFCGSCGTPLHASPDAGPRNIPIDQGNPFVAYFLGALKKYAQFEGRASRKEYWMFVLFSFLVAFAFGFIDGLISGVAGTETRGAGVFSSLYNLARRKGTFMTFYTYWILQSYACC
jgi:hypothetical protein